MLALYTIFNTPGVPEPLAVVLYLARLITCPVAIVATIEVIHEISESMKFK
jgi:hypothetical protein